MYDNHILIFTYFITHGSITSQQRDEAFNWLVSSAGRKHCTGIEEVKDSNTAQA